MAEKNIISVCEQHAVDYEMYDTNETDDIGRYAAAEKNQNHQQKYCDFMLAEGTEPSIKWQMRFSETAVRR